MQSTVNAIVGLQVLLSRLDDHRISMFNETEKVIITPFIRKVSHYAEKLSKVTGELQLHKSKQEQ